MFVSARTEEWNAGRIRVMQGFAVFAKILGARHQFAHLFEDGGRPAADLAPRPAESVDRGGAQRGDDGRQCGVVVQEATSL